VSRHPADYTTLAVRVRTAALALVRAKDSGESAMRRHGYASREGALTVRFPVGSGARVTVKFHVSRHGRTGNCTTWFRPASAPTPVPSSPIPASAPTTATPPPHASCYPTSDEGTCYEPGEYCRDDDHGMTGLAGDGEQIVCEDNDGWRWEPVN
jgi:hypothetical protein